VYAQAYTRFFRFRYHSDNYLRTPTPLFEQMMGRFIAVLKFLYYFESMDIEPEYLGVTTNEDGEIALSLFYEDGVQFDMYLDEQDLSDLIITLMFVAQRKRPWQKLH